MKQANRFNRNAETPVAEVANVETPVAEVANVETPVAEAANVETPVAEVLPQPTGALEAKQVSADARALEYVAAGEALNKSTRFIILDLLNSTYDVELIKDAVLKAEKAKISADTKAETDSLTQAIRDNDVTAQALHTKKLQALMLLQPTQTNAYTRLTKVTRAYLHIVELNINAKEFWLVSCAEQVENFINCKKVLAKIANTEEQTPEVAPETTPETALADVANAVRLDAIKALSDLLALVPETNKQLAVELSEKVLAALQ